MTQFRALVSAGCVLFALALTFVPIAYSQDKEASDSAIAELDKFISSKKIDKSSLRWRLGLPKPPQADFGAGDTEYFWNIESNKGLIKVRPVSYTHLTLPTILLV